MTQTNHIKRVGIVLAAGDSTRNPNKLLLPAVHCESDRSFPMVTQALNWLWLKTNCDKVCLVVQEGSTVHLYAQMMRFVDGGLLLAYQRWASGVVRAIQCGLESFAIAGVEFDEVLITFGDNAYDPRERVPSIDIVSPEQLGSGIASVRVLQDVGLDAFDDNVQNGHRWVERTSREYVAALPYRFAGWLLLSKFMCKYLRQQYFQTPGDLMQMLNTWNVQGVVVGPEYLWHDVGTPERYAQYLRQYLKACAKGGAT